MFGKIVRRKRSNFGTGVSAATSLSDIFSPLMTAFAASPEEAEIPRSDTATTHGLMAQTKVASNLGLRAVGALSVGDKVLTFDGGMQPITAIHRTIVWQGGPESDRNEWPVSIPQEALGNRSALTVLPEQGVLVESMAARDPFGDPFAVVPATALVGKRGIRRVAPIRPVELTSISFAREQVIYVEGGTLLYCPARTVALDDFLEAPEPRYDVLEDDAARILAECIVIEDEIDLRTPEVSPGVLAS